MLVEYILLGILSPILLNLMHLMVGLYVVVQRGNILSLGFSAMGFLTKSIGMIFLVYLGISILNLDIKIFIPLITFFWFFTHVVEGFVIQHYMRENESEYIKSIQIK